MRQGSPQAARQHGSRPQLWRAYAGVQKQSLDKANQKTGKKKKPLLSTNAHSTQGHVHSPLFCLCLHSARTHESANFCMPSVQLRGCVVCLPDLVGYLASGTVCTHLAYPAVRTSLCSDLWLCPKKRPLPTTRSQFMLRFRVESLETARQRSAYQSFAKLPPSSAHLHLGRGWGSEFHVTPSKASCDPRFLT